MENREKFTECPMRLEPRVAGQWAASRAGPPVLQVSKRICVELCGSERLLEPYVRQMGEGGQVVWNGICQAIA